MKKLLAVLLILCTGCATAPRNPLARVSAEDIEDIHIGDWWMESPVGFSFPTPLLTRYELYADLTMRYAPHESVISNLVALIRVTEPWPEDAYKPLDRIFLKAAFVGENETDWLGEVRVYGDAELIKIQDSPVEPTVEYFGRNRPLALELFRIVQEQNPDALRTIRLRIEKGCCGKETLMSYPFDELKDTEQSPAGDSLKAAPEE
jgi:hypothetical protein